MNIYSIYKITNTVNSKTYIGYTSKSVIRRFTEHCNSASKNPVSLLHKSMTKYGVDKFIVECIYQSTDKNHIKSEMENYFILEYDSFFKNKKGYNMTFGGDGGDTSASPAYIKSIANRDMSYLKYRGPVSLQTRLKISEAKKGKKPSNFNTWCKSSQGTAWYFCKDTNEQKRFLPNEVPPGWCKGRPVTSQSNSSNPRKATPVICIELNLRFDTVKSAASFVGLKCPRDIVDSIVGRGQRKSAGGFHWRFE